MAKDIDQAKEKDNKAKAKKPKKKITKKQDKKEIQIEELGTKLAELSDKYLRLSAEFDNYRRRTLKEKMELTKTAGEDILINLLPVLDNFERAIKSIEDSKDISSATEGVNLIYGNFKSFLTQKGIKEIDALEKEFDTDIHEALTKIPAPKKNLKGKVVDIIEKGYTLNEKVIRFSKVVVGE